MSRTARQKKIKKRLIVLITLAGILFVVSLLSPLLMPNDPYETHVALAKQGPSPEYPFGTDELGRCVLSRVLEGARTTIFSTLLLVAAMAFSGTMIGMISGYAGGIADTILMRITDFFLSFPQMIIAIVVAGVLGGGIANAMFALGITGWTLFARSARARVIAIKNEEYIVAAKLSGNGRFKLLFGYYFPNMTGPVLVNASMEIGTTMISLAGLSFLGLGAQPPAAEWGSMINEGRSMIQLAPQIVIAPAAAIFITVTIFNLLGDAVRDYADIGNRVGDIRARAKWSAAARDEEAKNGTSDFTDRFEEADDADKYNTDGKSDTVEKCNAAEKCETAEKSDFAGNCGNILLRVDHPTLYYDNEIAARDISFHVREGEILGIVGESGSGKSTILKSIIGPELFGIRVASGKIRYKGKDMMSMTAGELRKIRGEEIGMVIQEPGAFYNPIRPYEKQIRKTLADHGRKDWPREKERLLKIFDTMKLTQGEQLLKSCPFQLSGGMNQRVAIAAATLLSPKLLLADEPTSALDVTVQKKIIGELLRLNEEYGMAIIIVTHNIGVVRKMADRVIVLKDGEIIETGICGEVLDHPQMEYTKKLISAVPQIGEPGSRRSREQVKGNLALPESKKKHETPGCKDAKGRMQKA